VVPHVTSGGGCRQRDDRSSSTPPQVWRGDDIPNHDVSADAELAQFRFRQLNIGAFSQWRITTSATRRTDARTATRRSRRALQRMVSPSFPSDFISLVLCMISAVSSGFSQPDLCGSMLFCRQQSLGYPAGNLAFSNHARQPRLSSRSHRRAVSSTRMARLSELPFDSPTPAPA